MGIKLDPRAGFRDWLRATFGWAAATVAARPKRERKPAKPMKRFVYITGGEEPVGHECHAHTQSEARARFKRMTGGPLPSGAFVVRQG